MNRTPDKTPVAPTVNIAEHLARMAQRYPHKRAVVCPAGRDATGNVAYSHVTFLELEQLTNRYAHGLERVGIRRGTRTILMVRPSLDYFALTFALFKVGAVPVLIDPGIRRKSLVRCLAGVEAEAFIGVPLAHLLRTLHPRAFRSIKTVVTVGRRYLWGGHRLPELRAEPWRPYGTVATRADDVAAILFTSGSTGPSKGAVYQHETIDAQVRALQAHFGYGPEEVDLATFPLFALFDTAVGMTAVIPDMDPTRPGAADPTRIIAAIHDHGCTHMFGSPALLDRVSRYGEAHGIKLPSLRRVITAGAPVQPAILERFSRMLTDDAEIHTPYGATEALPVASIGSKEILGETQHQTAQGAGMCVGQPLSGVDVRIIAITDDPIPRWEDVRELAPGKIGEIVVRGPVVAREYFRRPEATARAKIHEGDDIWHRMGDVGYFDERGRLWFCGRKTHRVTTEHGTLFTVPCEAIFNQHPHVRRTALVGIGEPGRQKPVICIELEPNESTPDTEQLTSRERELIELGAANKLTSEVEIFLYHPAFPVDVRHNAKIFREKLAVWAAERLK
jgi:acyl-CoA synthetase (AMP-forming)/AMP-acid ligase II